MDRDLLRRYVALKIEQARLNAAIEKIKPAVVAEVDRAGGDVRLEGARLVARTSTTWRFSDDLEALMHTIKERKRGEIERGAAKERSHTRFVVTTLPRKQIPFRDATDPPPAETRRWLTSVSKEHPRAYSA